ncbi:MAG: WG repeat-containing protein [Bacteroidota bacterium]|jgi:hypothetical protein
MLIKYIVFVLLFIFSSDLNSQNKEYHSNEIVIKALDNGKFTYVTHDGKRLFQQDWMSVSDFREGYAVASSQDMFFGLDSTGKICFQKQFDESTSIEYAGEGLFTIVRDFKVGFLNSHGIQVIPSIYGGVVGALPQFSEGICCVIDSLETKYLFIDKSGKQVFDFTITGLCGGAATYQYFSFKNGLCVAHDNYKFGYINRDGNWVIKPQYDRADEFSEGLAAVRKKGKVIFINSQGQQAIKRDFGVMYDEGCCGFYYGKFVNGEAKVNIDITQVHIDPADFSNDNAEQRNWDLDKFAIINKEGKIVRYVDRD